MCDIDWNGLTIFSVGTLSLLAMIMVIYYTFNDS